MSILIGMTKIHLTNKEIMSPVEDYKPRGDKVFVTDMNFREQVTKNGIILMADDGKSVGVHPRWGKVHSIGPKNKDEFQVGDWVLVEHGRWTRGWKLKDGTTVRMIDNEAILAMSKDKPNEVFVGIA